MGHRKVFENIPDCTIMRKKKEKRKIKTKLKRKPL